MPEQNELVTILGVDVAKDAFANMDKFQGKLTSLVKNIVVAAGLLKGAQIFTGFVQGAIDSANALQKTSEATGLSTDAIQEWGYAAAKAGVDANAVQGDLQKLATQFGIFGAGADKAEERLLRLADTMHGMSTDKAARLGGMYGLSSDTSMLLAKEGRGGIQQAKQEAQDTGAVVSPEKLKQARQFKTELTGLQTIIKGIGTTMALTVVPYLNKSIAAFKDWFAVNRAWVQLRLNAVMEGLAMAFQRVWNAVLKVWDAAKKLLAPFEGLSDAFADSEIWANLFTGALVALGIALFPLIAPLLKMIAIGTLVSLVFEDFFSYLSGDAKSATGALIEAFQEKFPRAFAAIGTAIDTAKAYFSALWDTVKEVSGYVWAEIQTLAEPFDGLATEIGNVFDSIVDALGGPEAVIEGLKTALHYLGSVFKFVFGDIAVGAVKAALDLVTRLWSALGWVVDKVKQLFGLGSGGSEEEKEPTQAEKMAQQGKTATGQPIALAGIGAREYGDIAAMHNASLAYPAFNQGAKVAAPIGSQTSNKTEVNTENNLTVNVNNADDAAKIVNGFTAPNAQLNTPGTFSPAAG